MLLKALQIPLPDYRSRQQQMAGHASDSILAPIPLVPSADMLKMHDAWLRNAGFEVMTCSVPALAGLIPPGDQKAGWHRWELS